MIIVEVNLIATCAAVEHVIGAAKERIVARAAGNGRAVGFIFDSIFAPVTNKHVIKFRFANVKRAARSVRKADRLHIAVIVVEVKDRGTSNRSVIKGDVSLTVFAD